MATSARPLLPSMDQLRAAIGLIAIVATAVYIYVFVSLAFQVVAEDWRTRVGPAAGLHSVRLDGSEPVSRFARVKRSNQEYDRLRLEIHRRAKEPLSVSLPLIDYQMAYSWQSFALCLSSLYLLFSLGRRDVRALIRALLRRIVNFPDRAQDRVKEGITENWALRLFFLIMAALKLSPIVQSVIAKLAGLSFFAFVAVQELVRTYDLPSDFTPRFRFWLHLLIAITVFLIIVPNPARAQAKAPDETLGASRRGLLIAGLGLAASVAIDLLPASAKVSQWAILRRFPKPRHKPRKQIKWHQVGLARGLYRHRQSSKIYFVDDKGELRSPHAIRRQHLAKMGVPASADFPDLPRSTANAYFEAMALASIRRGQITEALDILERGCEYEIYRLKKHPRERPNIRVLKLYAGLSFRDQKPGHVRQLRKLVDKENLLAVLQPRPERWLEGGWQFKGRWYSRASYNGSKLAKTNRSI